MKKVERIMDDAYMVLSNLAFLFKPGNVIEVFNTKNITQKAVYRIRDSESVLLCDCNMSEANKYKSMAIMERNKKFLIEGYSEWLDKCKDGR